MSWISSDAEKIAGYIGKEAIDYRFPSVDRSCVSYFQDYDRAEVAIKEYSFSTIPELKNLLKKKEIVNSSDIDAACAIAAFINKPDKIRQEDDDEYILPTFIYNF